MNCVRCGAEMSGPEGKLYCSRKCSKAAQERRKRQRKWAMVPPRQCAVCGAVFQPYGLRTKTCSDDCTKRHKANLKVAWRRSGAAREYRRRWEEQQRQKDASIIAARKAERERERLERNAKAQSERAALHAERERIKRTCRRCGEQKPQEFRMHSGARERLCKRCRSKYQAEWKARNPESVRASRKARMERIKSDPVLLLKSRLRQRIQKAIRRMGKGVTVAGGKMRYLGCTAQQAASYLEGQFVGRMSWQNYGRAWHVDHVIPLAAFDLASEDGRKAAFHYTNIRPLWAMANLRKNATISDRPHQPELLLECVSH